MCVLCILWQKYVYICKVIKNHTSEKIFSKTRALSSMKFMLGYPSSVIYNEYLIYMI